MKTLVIGDIHGCGLELEQLIVLAGLSKSEDQIILVGDLFDRAKHAHLVWQVIQEWGERITCLQGNHERKMLKWLTGERSGVPEHYVWAVNDLEAHGVSRKTLVGFLGALPTIVAYRPYANGMGGKVFKEPGKQVWPSDVIITHAGVDVNWPLNPDPSFTVYGDVRRDPKWWDKYKGENLVLYGHLSELDCKPRIRTASPYKIKGDGHLTADDVMVYDSKIAPINSIGLDTACAHGGYLTGYIIETRETIRVKAQKDWAKELKEEMK